VARILLLTPQLPYPPHQGTTHRNFNIIRSISERHDLTLLSLWTGEESELDLGLKVLGQYCFKIEKVRQQPRSNLKRFSQLFSSSAPDMANRLRSAKFKERLIEILRTEQNQSGRPFDVIQIEGIEMANNLPTIREFGPESKIVFDNHNAEASLQRRAYETDKSQPRRWPLAAYSYVQTNRLQDYEKWVCESVDHVVAVSDQDLAKIKKLAPGIQATVIPNSIDVEEYKDLEAGTTAKFDLVFIGKMNYRPNVDAVLWFADRVWPIVQVERPQTTWGIVGQEPHARLDKLNALEGITITGKVDSVHPYLAGASIVVLPFRIGSGTRLKFIEAMAAGKALVSTTLGAEGFEIESWREALIADEPGQFARGIFNLLDDPEARNQLGGNAQEFAEKYDYLLVNKQFDAIYEDLVSPKQL